MSAQESQHPYGVLTKKRVLIFSAAGVFLVAGLSALVGSVGAPGEASFDWTLASVFGTALGTTLLAAFTGALAYTTSGDVRATFDLANLARADQERQETPVVVLQSIKWHQEEKTKGRLGVECRNVGLGPALGIVVNPSLDVAAGEIVVTQGIRSTVLPGEIVKFVLGVEFWGYTGEITENNFTLSGTYRDRSQRRQYPLIVELQQPADHVGIGVIGHE